jgi:hypothetical protein
MEKGKHRFCEGKALTPIWLSENGSLHHSDRFYWAPTLL